MQRFSSVVALSLVAAGAAAALVVNHAVSNDAGNGSVRPRAILIAGADIDERLLALEAAVSEERKARQLLEEELLVLYAEIDRLENAGGSAQRETDLLRNEPASQASSSFGAVRLTEGSTVEEDAQEARRTAMIEAGLSPARADYIQKRESEMRFEMMQAYYDARNSGERIDPVTMNPEALLRADIGDADYEKYLQANGRPTSVDVSSVMASSPAERAGLQSGDQIVGYDGERVFSTSDLMQRTMSPGTGDVVVDVIRDGVQMQVVLPRGPIGVETGRIRRR